MFKIKPKLSPERLPDDHLNNAPQPITWGKFLGGLFLLSLLIVNPVQGCEYSQSEASPEAVHQDQQISESQTSNPSSLISKAPMVPQAIADKVLADLAQRTGQPIGNFKIKSSESENWPDSCLGLAQEGQMCAQVITPGWKITVQSGQETWVYRTNQNGRTVLLEP